MLMLFQTFLYPGDDFEQMFNLADLVFRNQVRNVSKSNEMWGFDEVYYFQNFILFSV
jgi:hypothetical protein